VSLARRCAALAAGAALVLPAGAAAHGVHAGAAPAGAAPAHERLALVLPLATNVRALTRFANLVSTPGSPDYGDYASVAWLAHHFGARSATRRRVVSYLREHGASDVSVDATGQLVEARMAVVAAERLFRTTLVSTPGARAARSLAPRSAAVVPRALRGLVTGVVGLDTESLAHKELPSSSGYQGPDPGATPSGCTAGVKQGGFTPNEYLDAYGYAPLQQQGLLGQGERVALIEIDGFLTSDLKTFAACFHLHPPSVRAIPVGVSGPLAPGGESTLDLEVLEAAAPDLKAIDVYETGANAADVLKALSAPLQGAGFKPQVISVSLGLCEGNTLETVGQAGVRAIETVLKVASAAGVSVLGASGDMGSADCTQTGSSTPVPTLAVNFPSSSPWVTSVGGTNFDLNAQNQIVREAVWNDGSTDPGNAGGGGVSELFSRPSWQNGVVSSPWRAQPDVAMLADVSPGYAVYCTAEVDCQGRGWLAFGGTSAATPLLAGGFALIDEFLRRQGHIALGLANPLLYRLGRNPTSAAQVFYDVTSGSNDVGPFIGPGEASLGCCTARGGYDEASGWGGVNLDALAQAALTAQHPLATATLALPPNQRPVSSGGVYATVGCSAACDVAAYAHFSANGMSSFTDYAFAHLIHRNHRRLKLLFNAAQAARLKAARGAHRQILASVVAAIVDSGGNIERRTATLTLNVSG
jgi:subtilase family serine protease